MATTDESEAALATLPKAEGQASVKTALTPTVIVPLAPLSADQITAQIQHVHTVLKQNLVENQHYGLIPGCGDKPVLFKAGAEKLALAFHLRPEYTVEAERTRYVSRYTVHCKLFLPDGQCVSAGLGEASTGEDKYAWRKALSDEEFAAASPEHKRVKYKRAKGGGAYPVNQLRVNPADQGNTVLKMSKKRAYVDAVITACAASDILTQDIDDIPPELLGNQGSPPAQPAARNLPGAPSPQTGSTLPPEAAAATPTTTTPAAGADDNSVMAVVAAYPGKAMATTLHADDIPVIVFGCRKAKGKNLRECNTDELEKLRWYHNRQLEDGAKSRFREEHHAWILAIDAEEARRDSDDGGREVPEREAGADDLSY